MFSVRLRFCPMRVEDQGDELRRVRSKIGINRDIYMKNWIQTGRNAADCLAIYRNCRVLKPSREGQDQAAISPIHFL
jgi:hypothetical protein